MIDIAGLLGYVINQPLAVLGINLLHPLVLLLIIPLFFLLWWFMKKDIVKFATKEELEEHRKEKRGIRKIVFIFRIAVLIMLLVAIASPYSTQQKSEKGDTTLTLLVDKSSSFEIFNDNVAEELKEKLEGDIPVEIRYLAYGNDSSIGDALMNNIQGDDNIMIITDGNSNAGKSLGDMMLFASSLNTTISALKIEPEKSDLSVVIDGPSEAIYGNEMTFYVDVTNVGEEIDYHIKLMINDGVVLDKDATGTKTFEIDQRLIPGYHKITAEITADDYFQENNVFYKTIHVLERPHILLISEQDTILEDLLDKIYTVSRKYEIPADLDEYNAVLLNDVSNAEIKPRFNVINDYVDEGGGLVVIGGKNSYDRGDYMNNLIETLIPVKVGVSELDEENDVNIVMVIDISGTTTFDTGEGNTKMSVQKAQAIEILSNMAPENYVGVVAFDTSGYYVTPNLLPLGEQKDLNETIKNIKAEIGSGTFVSSGLEKAKWMLYDARGSKNVILISDGITSIPQQAFADARAMNNKGITIHTVGIGSDTDTAFMTKLAEIGGGNFYQPSDSQKLTLLFGGQKEQTNENQLVIMDNNHFITTDLGISGEVTGYNQVVPKETARLLIMTQGGYPILTTWRFGLGRVAAFTTDDGSGWSGSLFSKDNTKLISRMVNWAIGNPERNKEFEVSVSDAYLNEPAEIIVYSDQVPTHEDLSFSKVEENIYVAYFTADEPGFYDFFDAIVAINYDKEFKQLGFNDDIKSLVTVTGGDMFTMDQPEDIIEFVKQSSKKTKTDFTYYRWPFIIFALLLFLTELVLRRYYKNKENK